MFKLKNNYSGADSFSVSFPLAFVGGFLDLHTYMFRGGVFANAQTGNIVVLCYLIATRDFKLTPYYIIPISAYFLGIVFVGVIKRNAKLSARFSNLILWITAALLFVVGFVPQSAPNDIVNVTVSFACAMQYACFKTVRGLPYASTMCTGNLRSLGEKFMLWVADGKEGAFSEFICYLSVIIFFCAGAVSSAFITSALGGKALWVCAGLLLFTEIFMNIRNKNAR